MFRLPDSRKKENNRGRKSERERERRRVPRSLPDFFSGFGTKNVRYSLGQGRKEGETTKTEVGYLYSDKEGRQLA